MVCPQAIHRLFIKALESWAAATPLKRGLPGVCQHPPLLPLALIELDRFIEGCAIYYGRYVDDILLVKERCRFWLYQRIVEMAARSKAAFQPKYLKKDSLPTAKTRYSCWKALPSRTRFKSVPVRRAMPRLPRSDTICWLLPSGWRTSDNLRKTDALTMRRAGFAIKLRDFEALICFRKHGRSIGRLFWARLSGM